MGLDELIVAFLAALFSAVLAAIITLGFMKTKCEAGYPIVVDNIVYRCVKEEVK